jgi:hypothetical protein
MPLIFLFFILYLIPLFLSAIAKDSEISFIFKIIAIIIGSVPVVLATFTICLVHGVVYGLLLGLLLFVLLFFISKGIHFIIFKAVSHNGN